VKPRSLPESLLDRAIPADALPETFAEAARMVGCEVLTSNTPDSTLTALLAPFTRIARLDLGAPLPCPPFDLEACVVRATLAIAASGSILLDGDDLAPMTAPFVIALVDPKAIVPTLRDALSARRNAPLPRSRLIMTGPSKTADIEGLLVTGVHGPKRLSILLVD
jgi:L-lactate dehydrogenase complex protein LldG